MSIYCSEMCAECAHRLLRYTECISCINGSNFIRKANRFIPSIKKVIFNNPATIVIWNDGTKTVVKCCEDDEFDPEKGLAMAISKKALGGSLKEVRKWTDEYYKDLDSLDKTQFEDIVRAFNKLFK